MGRTSVKRGCSLGIGPFGQGRVRPLADMGLAKKLWHWVGLPGQSSPLGDSFSIGFAPWLGAVGWWISQGRLYFCVCFFASLRVQWSVARDRVWRLLSFQWPALAMVGPWAQQGFVPAVGPGLQRLPGLLLRSTPASSGIGCPISSLKGAMRR